MDTQGREIINCKAIMAEFRGFYQDIYDTKDQETCVDDIRS